MRDVVTPRHSQQAVPLPEALGLVLRSAESAERHLRFDLEEAGVQVA